MSFVLCDDVCGFTYLCFAKAQAYPSQPDPTHYSGNKRSRLWPPKAPNWQVPVVLVCNKLIEELSKEEFAISRLNDKGTDSADGPASSPIVNDEPPKKKVRRKNPSSPAGATTTPPTSADVDSELRGKTLKSYLFIMKLSKPVGVRELQRGLQLSSPSVAYHHLEKLERLGLVEKDQYGAYALVKNVDVSVLQAFSHVGTLLVPRFIFYAMFFTTLFVGYFLIYLGNSNVYALIFGAGAAAVAWYETIRTWLRRPF
jgi:DNA-binding transcriptional ArsR family regulator